MAAGVSCCEAAVVPPEIFLGAGNTGTVTVGADIRGDIPDGVETGHETLELIKNAGDS